MLRQSWQNGLRGILAVVLITALVPVASAGTAEDTGRAAWLMGRSQLEDLALTGQRFEQSEIGGGGSESVDVPGLDNNRSGMSGAWPVLMSMVLPGAGEVALGYKRGYVMAAADIFAWTQVAKYHGDGEDLRQEYYDFADKHYSDEQLVWAYYLGGHNDDVTGLVVGEGEKYFPLIGHIEDVEDLGDGVGNDLPLYVTREADLREYYENLGKWDQFIFGWDDYQRPDSYLPYADDYTGLRNPDLLQPWVSKNRETYREMREASNNAYKTRDRWLYMNIGLRVFSVLQVAYLQGLLGGGPGQEMEVSGHTIEIQATPMGFASGSLAARVSF